jgi:hypothetical protein
MGKTKDGITDSATVFYYEKRIRFFKTEKPSLRWRGEKTNYAKEKTSAERA